jgi:hypothetical protein
MRRALPTRRWSARVPCLGVLVVVPDCRLLGDRSVPADQAPTDTTFIVESVRGRRLSLAVPSLLSCDHAPGEVRRP